MKEEGRGREGDARERREKEREAAGRRRGEIIGEEGRGKGRARSEQ